MSNFADLDPTKIDASESELWKQYYPQINELFQEIDIEVLKCLGDFRENADGINVTRSGLSLPNLILQHYLIGSKEDPIHTHFGFIGASISPDGKGIRISSQDLDNNYCAYDTSMDELVETIRMVVTWWLNSGVAGRIRYVYEHKDEKFIGNLDNYQIPSKLIFVVDRKIVDLFSFPDRTKFYLINYGLKIYESRNWYKKSRYCIRVFQHYLEEEKNHGYLFTEEGYLEWRLSNKYDFNRSWEHIKKIPTPKIFL